MLRTGTYLITIWLVLAGLDVSAFADQWPPAPLQEVAVGAFDADTDVPSVTAIRNGSLWRCRFELLPAESVKSVALAGSFNDWNRATHRMQRQADGTWRVSLDLPGGKHFYKFVLDDGRWITDPRNAATEPDGHDGENSVLLLGRLARMTRSACAVGDGQIDSEAVEHAPASMTYFQPLSANQLLLRLRLFAHDIESAEVHLKGAEATPLRKVLSGPLVEYWEATVELPRAAAGDRRIEYAFVVTDGAARIMPLPPVEHAFTIREAFVTPDWARDAVWYQVMLDRFRNGDASNDPQPVHPWTSDWFKLQPCESDRWAESGQTERRAASPARDAQTAATLPSIPKRYPAPDDLFYKHAVFQRMYGGDLAGLIEKIPYLKELGINAIYLNPVFEADGHHKYNATNYVHIDDDFGTRGDYQPAAAKEDLLDPKTWIWTESDKLFLKALEACHAAGIRVIIDGVFNHVGTKHPAFVDVKKNGRASRFADWFEIKSWEPFEHVGWAGHDSLPIFRKSPDGLASQAVKRHIFDITRRWMDPNNDGDPRDGIDGWRLDVPNEIAPPFWEEWRALVKSINPDAYISGEIWDRADHWLDGRHFDAVMNYQFGQQVIYWALYDRMKSKVSDMDHALAELRLAYPRAATYVMQNLFDSHDTDRLASMALNPDRLFDQQNRVQDNGPQYNNDKPLPEHYQKARLAALVQMTYVGAPMIYYGDEAGMWGADDPTCRKPMLWEDLQPYQEPEENHVMREHLAYYRQLISLRNAHPALRRGDYQTLLVDDQKDVWIFARFDEREKLIVALNGSDQVQDVKGVLPDRWAGTWRRVFPAADLEINLQDRFGLSLPARSGAVFATLRQ